MSIEKAVIGALLLDNSNWYEVREIVSDEHFKDINMAFLFKAIESFDGKCDIVLLSGYLRRMGKEPLIKLATDALDYCEPSQTVEYAKEIKEKYRKERALSIGERIKKLPEHLTANDIIKHTESDMMSLMDGQKKNFRPIGDIAFDYLERLMMLKEKGLKISGLPTGFPSIDNVIDGLKAGELIIIGARPSIGKTSLMLCMADFIATFVKKHVAIFSIESPENEIMNKMVSSRAEILLRKLRTNDLTADEHGRMMNAIDILGTSSISINDVSSIDLISIKAQVKRLINKGKYPDVIFVDYLQIIEVEKSPDTFANKIGRITQGLKNLAKELMIPVVVLAQINRANEEQPPRLIDLKDSGAIEAIADVVLLLHREEFYKKENCSKEKMGKIDIDTAKNRNGPVKLLEMGWIGKFTKVIEIIK